VQKIHKLTKRELWRHCPGKFNPADLLSRGLSGEDLALNQVWWNGPLFLQSLESGWPLNRNGEMNEDIRAELCKHTTDVSFMLLSTVTGKDTMLKIDQLIYCARFSNYL